MIGHKLLSFLHRFAVNDTWIFIQAPIKYMQTNKKNNWYADGKKKGNSLCNIFLLK